MTNVDTLPAIRRVSEKLRKEPIFVRRQVRDLRGSKLDYEKRLAKSSGDERKQLIESLKSVRDDLEQWKTFADFYEIRLWSPADVEPGDVLFHNDGGFAIVTMVNTQTFTIDAPHRNTWGQEVPQWKFYGELERGGPRWAAQIRRYGAAINLEETPLSQTEKSVRSLCAEQWSDPSRPVGGLRKRPESSTETHRRIEAAEADLHDALAHAIANDLEVVLSQVLARAALGEPIHNDHGQALQEKTLYDVNAQRVTERGHQVVAVLRSMGKVPPLPERAPTRDDNRTTMTTPEDETSEGTGNAPLRVTYAYEAGILICGDTYEYRAAIKGLRTKRVRFSRNLDGDCTWYIPRSRNTFQSRALVESIAQELRESTGVDVDVEYEAVDPSNLPSKARLESDLAERSLDRADRLEGRASRKHAESGAAQRASHDAVRHIPPGQPILVGHHSERRHRRDLQRSHSKMRKAIEADKHAKRLESSARQTRAGVDARKGPHFARRRIDEAREELRKIEMLISGVPPKGWRGFIPEGPATGDYKTRLEVRRAELLSSIEHWQHVFEESGAKHWGPDDFRPGDVLSDGSVVVRVNKKTLSVDYPKLSHPDQKLSYSNVRGPIERGSPAWFKAITFYEKWATATSHRLARRAKLARKWLAEARQQAAAAKPSTEDPNATNDDPHAIAQTLAPGEKRYLVLASTAGTPLGIVMSESLGNKRLYDREQRTLTPLGHAVAAILQPKSKSNTDAPPVLDPPQQQQGMSPSTRSLYALTGGSPKPAGKDIAKALRKLLHQRHPELALSLRTVKLTGATFFKITAKGGKRRWTQEERTALATVFDDTISIAGDDASFTATSAKEGGALLSPEYVEDFRTIWQGRGAPSKSTKPRRKASSIPTPRQALPEDPALRVQYTYDGGILVCGETYPHRKEIKALQSKQFMYSRNLPDDCAWFVPRSRNQVTDRSSIEEIARELSEATGVRVDVDYTKPDPDDLPETPLIKEARKPDALQQLTAERQRTASPPAQRDPEPAPVVRLQHDAKIARRRLHEAQHDLQKIEALRSSYNPLVDSRDKRDSLDARLVDAKQTVEHWQAVLESSASHVFDVRPGDVTRDGGFVIRVDAPWVYLDRPMTNRINEKVHHEDLGERINRNTPTWRRATTRYGIWIIENAPEEIREPRERLLAGWMGVPVDDPPILVDPSRTDPHDIVKKLAPSHAQLLVDATFNDQPVESLLLGAFLHMNGLYDVGSRSVTDFGRQVASLLAPAQADAEVIHLQPPRPSSTPAQSTPLLTLMLREDRPYTRTELSAALRKLIKNRHPEVSFSVRTPSYADASEVVLRPRGAQRKWTRNERDVLHALFGDAFFVQTDDSASVDVQPLSERGSALSNAYVEDFRALLQGKRSATKTRASKPKSRASTKAKTKSRTPKPMPTKKRPANEQASIWDAEPDDPRPTRPRSRRDDADPNPPAQHHMVAAYEDANRADEMLMLAEKAPPHTTARMSAAADAYALATVAMRNAQYALDVFRDGPSRQTVANYRRKAAAIAQRAQQLLGAQRTSPRRSKATPNPSKRTSAKASSRRASAATDNPNALRARRLLAAFS